MVYCHSQQECPGFEFGYVWSPCGFSPGGLVSFCGLNTYKSTDFDPVYYLQTDKVVFLYFHTMHAGI